MTQIPGYLVNKNVYLRTTVNPKKSFILDELTPETVDEVFHEGSFFNR